MTEENVKRANVIIGEINTLEQEIKTLTNMESNTRDKRECTHRLLLKKLLRRPSEKTVFNYWSSQDLDSIHSIILFDADEVKLLVDYKKDKANRLKEELNSL